LSDRPTQAVILAGGRGTRLRPITDTIPKAMVPFHGEPFLGHIVRMLADRGFTDVLLLEGHLAGKIQEHFGDGGDYRVRVRHRVTDPDALTAFRVLDALDEIDDRFLLLYCDNYWPMRFEEMWEHYLERGVPSQITVYSNDDGYTRDSVIVEDGMCRVFDRTRRTPGLAGVEISYAILEKRVVAPLISANSDELFEQAVYPVLAERGQLAAYWTDHRYYSVGSHERLPLTDAFFARVPTVILDRDGTLNRRPPRAQYVTSPETFYWQPGVPEALARLHQAGWRVLIVTNQAGLARGAMTESQYQAVTTRMQADVESAGGHITHVYHCPHDWNEGCGCRKPAPGMLIQAQRDYHLDLTKTFYIGDDDRDLQAATAAGCNAALVGRHATLPQLIDRLLAGELETTVR
jgi:histidinol-phosphate phosphatase family protein